MICSVCPGLLLDPNGRAVVIRGNDDNKMSAYSAAIDGWSVGTLVAAINLLPHFQMAVYL